MRAVVCSLLVSFIVALPTPHHVSSHYKQLEARGHEPSGSLASASNAAIDSVISKNWQTIQTNQAMLENLQDQLILSVQAVQTVQNMPPNLNVETVAHYAFMADQQRTLAITRDAQIQSMEIQLQNTMQQNQALIDQLTQQQELAWVAEQQRQATVNAAQVVQQQQIELKHTAESLAAKEAQLKSTIAHLQEVLEKVKPKIFGAAAAASAQNTGHGVSEDLLGGSSLELEMPDQNFGQAFIPWEDEKPLEMIGKLDKSESIDATAWLEESMEDQGPKVSELFTEAAKLLA